MRLIKASSVSVVEREFWSDDIPPYGILSHTWEGGEVSYQDMMNDTAMGKDGYRKIEMTCKLALADKLEYVWVDTCCIDKTCSAELSEAINSMFQWYKRAAVCYVWLSDLKPSPITDLTAAKACKWFTRGWTLQELIAPKEVRFYDQRWTFKGTKTTLLQGLSTITGVDSNVLNNTLPLSSVAVARRMSWAATRKTTREEDIAYCLLGIFDVNMPMLYGEGPKAFFRLQEEIIKGASDLSIFAWTLDRPNHLLERYSTNYHWHGVIANSPTAFSKCGRIVNTKESTFHGDFSVTNRGIRMYTSIRYTSDEGRNRGYVYVQSLDCTNEGEHDNNIVIFLRKWGPDTFVREHPHEHFTCTYSQMTSHFENLRSIYILSKIPRFQSSIQERTYLATYRSSAIQIRLPEGLRFFKAEPASHFDASDCVFFSTAKSTNNWCYMQVLGGVTTKRSESVAFGFNFVCTDWNHKPSSYIWEFIRDNSTEFQIVSDLENRPAHIVPLGLLRLPLTRENGGGIELKQASRKAHLWFVIRQEYLPDICSGPAYVVEFKLDV